MTLKKNLNKILTGQTTLECVMLFTVIALVTLLAFSNFYVTLKNKLQGQGTSSATKGFFQRAVDKIAK